MSINRKNIQSFERWRSRWISSVLEVFIVFSISKKERFGGELVELSKQSVDENAKIPTIYAILKRLTDSGFLKEKSKSQEIGITRGKPRTYYEITPGGKTYLESMQRQINSSLIPWNFKKNTLEEE